MSNSDVGSGLDALDQLGRRLIDARRAHGLSQRSMAARVGVSASMISQIETGKVQPSVATLMSIANELELSIDQLLGAAPVADEPDVASVGRRGIVQSPRTREVITLSTGVRWERLTVHSDSDVEFLLVTYPPGAVSADGQTLLTHAGKEYWYILAGRLSVQVVFDTYTAGPEDSFAFECSAPHRFHNAGTEPVTAVVLIVHQRTDSTPDHDVPQPH